MRPGRSSEQPYRVTGSPANTVARIHGGRLGAHAALSAAVKPPRAFLIQELADRGDDRLLLFVGQFGIDRHRECLTRGRFGVRKIAGVMAQRREARLQVQRNRVVDLRADLRAAEVVTQRVAQLSGTRITYWLKTWRLPVALAGQPGDRSSSWDRTDRDTAPRPRGGLESRRRGAELDAQHGGLEGVEPRIDADLVVVVLGLHAVDPQPGQSTGRARGRRSSSCRRRRSRPGSWMG